MDEGGFNKKKWFVIVCFTITYTIVQIVIAPTIDRKFLRDTSQVMAINYLSRHEFSSDLLWEPDTKENMTVIFEGINTGINEDQQNSMISEDFITKESMHPDFGGKEEEGGPKCSTIPLKYDPLIFFPYFLEERCNNLKSYELSPQRAGEILSLYTNGTSNSSFYLDSMLVGSKCANELIVDQEDHDNPNVFYAYMLLKLSFCVLECKHEIDHERLKSLSNTDPWFMIDWVNSNTSLIDTTINVLDTVVSPLLLLLNGNTTFEPRAWVKESFKTRYSWMYSCDLKREILDKGGVTLVFDTVWEFLVNYRSGVYSLENIPTERWKTRRMAVLLVGWGVEEVEGIGLVRYFIGLLPYGETRGVIKINENDLYIKGSKSIFLRGVYTLSLKNPTMN
jgi:hypothetical protein